MVEETETEAEAASTTSTAARCGQLMTEVATATLIAAETAVPYPPGTKNYHHEMELVIAIGKPVFQASRQAAKAAIYR